MVTLGTMLFREAPMKRMAALAAVTVVLVVAGSLVNRYLSAFEGEGDVGNASAAVASSSGSVAAPLAAPAQQKPDVLYTWVDKDGVTHFEQGPQRGTRVVYDGSRITPLPPPPAPSGKEASTSLEVAKEKTEEGLHKLRRELEAGAQRMQQTRAATGGGH
ncbi:MAG: hypothetical protein K0S16_2073 [Moraxellaceae bacterium]|nr:hypothetical protein [Moraxellaceae bacterium]